MKLTVKRSIIGIAISSVLFAGVLNVASARPHHQNLKAVLKQLDLDATQKQDIRQLMKEKRGDASLVKEDIKSLHQQMKQLIQADQWDAEQASALIESRSSLMNQMALQRAMGRHSMWQILTEQQQSQFDDIAQNKRQGRKGNRMHRILSKLELSEQQQTQVEEIVSAMEQSRESFKEQRKALKSAERDLVRAEVFDEQAWQDLYAQYSEGFATMAMQTSFSRHQIWNLLTPEQQDKVEHMQLHQRQKRRQMRGHSPII